MVTRDHFGTGTMFTKILVTNTSSMQVTTIQTPIISLNMGSKINYCSMIQSSIWNDSNSRSMPSLLPSATTSRSSWMNKIPASTRRIPVITLSTITLSLRTILTRQSKSFSTISRSPGSMITLWLCSTVTTTGSPIHVISNLLPS